MSRTSFHPLHYGLTLLGSALLLSACAGTQPLTPYPHESALAVVAELKLYLDRDAYTHPPGTDLHGGNIFRVSLTRLDQLESFAPESYADIIAMARGRCLARLGNWPAAAAALRACETHGTALAGEAAERAALAERIAQLDSSLTGSETLSAYLDALAATAQALRGELAAAPDYLHGLLWREIEQREVEHAHMLMANRMVLPEGPRRAVEAAEKLAADHALGFRAMEHQLRLGGVFEQMARDWATQFPPDREDFAANTALGDWINRARSAYRTVAQADGDPARPEGEARLRALEAFVMRIELLAK